MRLLKQMSRSFLLDVRVSTVVFFLLAFTAACQSQAPPDTRAADEATLRKLDDEWSKAAGSSRDVEKTISYYSDDAVVMPPNIPTLTGKEAIRTLWKSMLESPAFSGVWKATKVEVARSGDLAYVSGNYEFNETDDRGNPLTDRGKYLEIWRKQADGSWKCVADMFNSDLPNVAPGRE
jgi:ketosteroid isomerase-like protein